MLEHLNNITFCGNSSLLRDKRAGARAAGSNGTTSAENVLTENEEKCFRLTFNVNCSGRSDKFARSETVLTRGKTNGKVFFFCCVAHKLVGQKRRMFAS